MNGNGNIRLGTVFSGIGAIEQVFMKTGLAHTFVFACDNGERSLPQSRMELENILTPLPQSDREHVISELYNSQGENLMEKSYKANYAIQDDSFFQDIRFLDGTRYQGKLDLLVGGSPCQAFSCNGKRGGFADTRGTLFYEFARIIHEAQPRCFIYENVKGMLTHDGGKTWSIIKNTFRELNYDIYIKRDMLGKEVAILDAKDYGIPQQRKRLYVVGIRRDISLRHTFSFPQPMQLHTTIYDYLDNKVSASYYLGKKGFEFVTTHPSRARVGSWIMNCQKANQQFNWNGDFIFEPLSEKHTPEILSHAYVGEWNGSVGVIRKFTPRECLRLMGFLDSFKIVVNDNVMYRQSGNSIVVNVLEKLLQELIKTGVFAYDD